MDLWHDLILNYYFLAPAFALFSSVLFKALWHSWKDSKKFHIIDGVQNGGMPSSHTAVVSALTFSLLFRTGMSDLFFISAVFSAITMIDALKVRQNVGLQGEKLNDLLRKFDEKTIKVVYGHSFVQIMAGMILGFVWTLIFKAILF